MSAAEQDIVKSRKVDDACIAVVTGDIDLSRSPSFRMELLQLLQARPARMIVDLTAVPFMDSSGVATLVEALRQVNGQGGKLILCGMNPRVRSVFQVSRLDSLFTIKPDINAATAT